MLVSIFYLFLILSFLLLSVLSFLYCHFFLSIYRLLFLPLIYVYPTPPPPPINLYSPSLLPIFRNCVGKTTKTLKHTHTAHSFFLPSHFLSTLLSSCFIFLFPYSISITIFEMGKAGKYMYNCVWYVYSVLSCVIRPVGGGWRWKVRVRKEGWRQQGWINLAVSNMGEVFCHSFFFPGCLCCVNSNIIAFLFSVYFFFTIISTRLLFKKFKVVHIVSIN